MANKCIFSGSTENVNTSMKVKLEDGSTVEVWISDEFADDATPKTVREAYIKSKASYDSEYDELVKRAAAMGLVIAPKAEVAAAASANKKLTEVPPQVEARDTQRPWLSEAVKPQTTSNGTRIIDGSAADRPLNFKVADINGVGGGGAEYAITSGDKPSENLKAGETAEIKMIVGRGGVPTAVPVHRSGKTGTTTVDFKQDVDDRVIQTKFKEMSTKGNRNACYREGYDHEQIVRCTLCRGSGIMMGNRPCQKCGGSGQIDVA